MPSARRQPNPLSFLFTLLGLAFAGCQDSIVQPAVAPESAGEARIPDAIRSRPAFTLTILHNNDGESSLLSEGNFGGVARFARTVADLKRDAVEGCRDFRPPLSRGASQCDVIMVSSGDNFLAGPQFTASLDKGVPFYDSVALDYIGYDAIAIGNHEFDFGPDILADFIDGFGRRPPPFLSANLDFSGEPRLVTLRDRGSIAASTIVQLKGARVGIIGATTPRLREISSPRNVVVREDVAAAIMTEVEQLRRRAVSQIILISHLQSVREDLALIPMLSHVDVVVAGGGDELLSNPGDLLIPGDEGLVTGTYPLIAQDADGMDVPVITTSGQYRYVGRLEVSFNMLGEVLMAQGGPVRVEGAADPVVMVEVEAPVAAAVAELKATVIGATGVILDGRRPQVRTVETNEGNLIADALRWQATQLAASFGAPVPAVALQNGGGIRNDELFGPGPITSFDTFTFLPFPNFVSIVPGVTRSQFKMILENAVSRVEFVDGRFAQVSGFSFSFNPSAPAGSRVVDVTLNGGEAIVVAGIVQPGTNMAVATIDFLARGGDGYPFGGLPFTTVGVTYQQALENYIQIGLGGTVSATGYPAGGEGRITRVP